MDHVAAELKLPPWMEPVALTGFLDELRDSGYNVGTAQYIAAHDLVVALTARGEELAAPARFGSFLGPLICQSPREQEEFRTLFERWVSRFEPGKGDGATERRASEEEVYGELRKVGRRSRLWMLWIGLLALLLVGFFWYLRDPGPGLVEEPPEPTVEQTPQPALPVWEAREITAGLLVLLLLTLVAWRQWWRYRAHLFLVRLATTDDPRIERLAVRGLVDELFEKHFLLRTIQGFRQRFEVPSRDLDIEGTIHATMRNGGWFSPVFGRRSLTPEYLVLIDRASHRDQQARLIEELVHQLEKSHVFVSRWYFDGDPRLCFPSSERELPLTLAELRARYPEHRLLLFTDGSGLFDFGLGELAPWVEQLAQWKQRALLTPRPIEQWRQRELTLRSQLMVLPATAEGLAHLSRIFTSERPHAPRDTTPPSLMPEDLRLRPQRWLSRDAPEDRLVERVLSDLEQFLGDAGFYWLSACAVYPALSWDLVLHLGNELQAEEGDRLLTPDRLAALGQLPWFRNGYIPDWLRLRLVGGMPKEREQAVRDLLRNLLLTTLAGVRHDFYLEIAQRERRTLSRLMRQALDVLARRSPEESPLKDHVFRDFMAGRRKRLGVRLPERIAALFADPGVDRSLTHARAHRAIRALLLTDLALSLTAICLRFTDISRYTLELVLLSLSTAAVSLLLLGCALKRTRVALSGLPGMLPLAIGVLFYENVDEVPNLLLMGILLLSIILIAAAWRPLNRTIPAPSWRLGIIVLTEIIACLAAMIVSLYFASNEPDTYEIPSIMAFVLWPCLGLALITIGYVEKSVWSGRTGIVYLVSIPLALVADAIGNFQDNVSLGSIGAITLAVGLTTSFIDLRYWLRRKEGRPV